jgi:hypothetical protein
MDTQIPAITEKTLSTSGCRKFQLDPRGDHLNTCTAHSGAKKTHDWMVDLLTFFHDAPEVNRERFASVIR